MVYLERYKKNPVLKPNPNYEWQQGAVFNCGATLFKEKIILLYRAIGNYETYISTLGLAESDDGYNFKARPEPVMVPEEPFEKYGVEDPRITWLEGKYYICYTAVRTPVPAGDVDFHIGIASTSDFKTFKKYGTVINEYRDKDGVLFPEKINGRYALMHRAPEPDMWIAYSKDLKNWTDHKKFFSPIKNSWQDFKVGAGAPPIKTDEGWVNFYHGVSKELHYSLGVMLLDLKDPTKIISIIEDPILKPELDYEKEGDVPNVCFTCGVVEKDKKFLVYYGAADKCIAVAFIDKTKLLQAL
ncbi:MAG: glycosidase [Candidatus Heimdallarchaeota archaeon]|nr:glycosidase [Candidatus Heimdallarchaeota archaeon]